METGLFQSQCLHWPLKLMQFDLCHSPQAPFAFCQSLALFLWLIVKLVSCFQVLHGAREKGQFGKVPHNVQTHTHILWKHTSLL